MASITDLVPAKTAAEGEAEDEVPRKLSVFDITYDYPSLVDLEKELHASVCVGDYVKNKEPELLNGVAKEFANKSGLRHEDIMVGVACAIYDYFKKKEKEMGDKEFVMYKMNYAAALVHIGKGNKLD